MSLWSDIKILLATPAAMITGKAVPFAKPAAWGVNETPKKETTMTTPHDKGLGCANHGR